MFDNSIKVILMLYLAGFEKAADHIEAHPEMFNFMSVNVPHDNVGIACAFGWTLYFSGVTAWSIDTSPEGPKHYDTFQKAMRAIYGDCWYNSRVIVHNLRELVRQLKAS